MLTEMLTKVIKRRKIKVFERCYSGFDSAWDCDQASALPGPEPRHSALGDHEGEIVVNHHFVALLDFAGVCRVDSPRAVVLYGPTIDVHAFELFLGYRSRIAHFVSLPAVWPVRVWFAFLYGSILTSLRNDYKTQRCTNIAQRHWTKCMVAQ